MTRVQAFVESIEIKKIFLGYTKDALSATRPWRFYEGVAIMANDIRDLREGATLFGYEIVVNQRTQMSVDVD